MTRLRCKVVFAATLLSVLVSWAAAPERLPSPSLAANDGQDASEKISACPQGYTLLKYIDSKSSVGADYWASSLVGPYIQIYNTDASPFVLGADDVVETKFQFNQKDAGACIFCVRGSSSSGKFVLMRAGNSPYKARFDYGQTNNELDQTKINLNNTDTHTAIASKSGITIDGTTIVPASSNYEPASNALLLFCCDNGGNGIANSGNKGTIRMYSFRVKDGSGNIRLNLVPMLRNSDSKPGLYDAVSGQFFTNKSANGEFSYSTSVTLIDRIAAETAFAGAADPYANGGDYTYMSGRDYVHVFSSTKAAQTFTVVNACTADILVVGGGAGGSTGSGGSGGNAGKFVPEVAVPLSSGSYTVAVGAGGAGNSDPGGSGGDSSLIGGTLEIKAEGGTGNSHFNALAGDGGTGAGGSGGEHVAAKTGGDGGAAVASSVLGWPEAFAGGGGGSGQYMNSGGAGGSVVIDETKVVIGGAGTTGDKGGNSGAVGTGSGGSGGAANYKNGGSGANGIVIIRVKAPPPKPKCFLLIVQ